jgi:glycosyltransferase involved in cell wall biosynthesis
VKIGFILPWESFSLPHVGGSLGIWTWEVARRLAPSHEILVFCQCPPGAAGREEIKGVRFLRFSLALDMRLMALMRRVRRYRNQPDFACWFYFYFYVLRAANVLRTYDCDVIHIFNLSQFAPILARFNPRAKIVLNMHCDWLLGLDYSVINNRLKRVDKIVGCANCITDDIRSRFPHYAHKCETVYNGVDTNTFYPANRRVGSPAGETLITVGRVSPEKGLHVLLEAFETILEKRPTAKLRVIGPESILPAEVFTKGDNSRLCELMSACGGNYLQSLQERVNRSMPQNVSFVGQLSRTQTAEEMRNATILVQPSLYDLLPLPVIEGMMTGIPIVASQVGGLSEVILDGETGLLVKAGDSVKLAEALMMLLDSPSKGHTLGAAGHARAVYEFSWEATVDRLGLCYQMYNKSEGDTPNSRY